MDSEFLFLLSQFKGSLQMIMKNVINWNLLYIFITTHSSLASNAHLRYPWLSLAKQSDTVVSKSLIHLIKYFDELFRTFLLLLRNDHHFQHDATQGVYNFLSSIGRAVIKLQNFVLMSLPVTIHHNLFEYLT